MIRHVFKLAWNRRRANGLILVELIGSFLVLCGVLTFVVYLLDQWRRPMGFDYDNVWHVGIDSGPYTPLSEESKRTVHDRVARLVQEVRSLPEVERLSTYDYNVPFGHSTAATLNYVRGVRTQVELSETDAELKDVLGLEVIAGRWLEPGDGDLNWVPLVITQNYAELLYGNEDPVGRELLEYKKDGTLQQPDEDDGVKRIVGVVQNIRRASQCAPAPLSEFLARPTVVESVSKTFPPVALLLKVKPGTTAAFEEKVLRLAHGVAPDWKFEATTLDEARRGVLRDTWMPLLMSGLVAGFLIIMVGMGLVGVLWQTVARRTRELGLRRALGATAAAVRWQVLGELLALTTGAVVVGALVFLQLPILKVFTQAGFNVYLIGLAIGMLVLYPFVVLCGLYPSWLATRVHPVQALQHE
jgi:putative ABC transport system permease protein